MWKTGVVLGTDMGVRRGYWRAISSGFLRDAFGLVGDNENKCQVFTNGKMVEGTWKRTELFEPAKYYAFGRYREKFFRCMSLLPVTNEKRSTCMKLTRSSLGVEL